MKVRCVKLMRWDGTPVGGTTNGWLTLGKEYHVLAIYGGKGPVATTYRVRTDDPSRSPGMQPAEQFEIISPEISIALGPRMVTGTGSLGRKGLLGKIFRWRRSSQSCLRQRISGDHERLTIQSEVCQLVALH
jgi:hypothetical protein